MSDIPELSLFTHAEAAVGFGRLSYQQVMPQIMTDSVILFR
jgi:hypothetical protein